MWREIVKASNIESVLLGCNSIWDIKSIKWLVYFSLNKSIRYSVLMVIFVFLYMLQETVFESELVDKSNELELKEGKEKAKGNDRSSLVIFENEREYTSHYFIILQCRWQSLVDGSCCSRGTREFRRVIIAGDLIILELLMHAINVLFSLSNSPWNHR